MCWSKPHPYVKGGVFHLQNHKTPNHSATKHIKSRQHSIVQCKSNPNRMGQMRTAVPSYHGISDDIFRNLTLITDSLRLSKQTKTRETIPSFSPSGTQTCQ